MAPHETSVNPCNLRITLLESPPGALHLLVPRVAGDRADGSTVGGVQPVDERACGCLCRFGLSRGDGVLPAKPCLRHVPGRGGALVNFVAPCAARQAPQARHLPSPVTEPGNPGLPRSALTIMPGVNDGTRTSGATSSAWPSDVPHRWALAARLLSCR